MTINDSYMEAKDKNPSIFGFQERFLDNMSCYTLYACLKWRKGKKILDAIALEKQGDKGAFRRDANKTLKNAQQIHY